MAGLHALHCQRFSVSEWKRNRYSIYPKYSDDRLNTLPYLSYNLKTPIWLLVDVSKNAALWVAKSVDSIASDLGPHYLLKPICSSTLGK